MSIHFKTDFCGQGGGQGARISHLMSVISDLSFVWVKGKRAAKGMARGRWPLVRGIFCFWDPKKVAAGRVPLVRGRYREKTVGPC